MITLAKRAGYCFGVRRAVQMAEENATLDNPLYAAGPLIHNRHVIQDLRKRGVITAETLSEIPDGVRVIIRAHGVPPEDIAALQRKGCTVLDATCPYVARIHMIAEEESKKGRGSGLTSFRALPLLTVSMYRAMTTTPKDICNCAVSMACILASME